MTRERFKDLLWCRLGFHDWTEPFVVATRVIVTYGGQRREDLDYIDKEDFRECRVCHIQRPTR